MQRRLNHKRIKRILLMMSTFLLISFFIRDESWNVSASSPDLSEGSQSERIVKVAFPIRKGLSEIDKSGNPSGLVVDYLDEIAKYNNWEYEYIEVAEEHMINEFLEGDFDLLGGIYFEEQLEPYLAYSDYNMGSSRSVLICKKDNDSLNSYNIKSLNNKMIGVYEDETEKILYLEEFFRINGIQCELRYYPQADRPSGALYQALEDEEIDLLLEEDGNENTDFHVVAYVTTQPYYIVTAKEKEEILQELNLGLAYLLTSIPDFEEKHYADNFQDMRALDIHFSEKELEYIQEKKVVKVAGIKDSHPFFCVNNPKAIHRGLVLDLFDEISKVTGFEFEYIYMDTYIEAIHLVQNGEADVMGCFFDSNFVAESQGLALTRNYVTMNNIVVKNKSVQYPDQDLVGAAIEGCAIPSDIITKDIKYYPTTVAAIKAADRGEVDFVYGLSARLEREIQNYKFSNVAQVTMINMSGEISMALGRPVTPELLSILNKAIGSLSTETKEALLNSNLVSVPHTDMSLSDIVYANPFLFVSVVILLLVLISTAIVIIIKIRLNNKLMQNDLKKAEAEAESKARAEFLSKMSHELRTPMNAIVGLSELTCMMNELPQGVENNLIKIRSSSQYLLSLINDILDMSRIENGMMSVVKEPFSLVHTIDDLEHMIQIQAEKKQLKVEVQKNITNDTLIGDSVRLRQVLANLLTNAFKFTEIGGKVILTITETESTEESTEIMFSVKDNGIGIAQEHQERIFVAFEQVKNDISKTQGVGLGLQISYNLVKLMGGEIEVYSEVGQGAEFYFTLPFVIATQDELKSSKLDIGEDLKGLQVLFAEDNELNAEITIELLKLKEIKADWAKNGQEAVEMFAESESGHYQLILMDIQMPVKDGLEATRDIRKENHPDAEHIPIVAMTANSFKEDIKAAEAAGMNSFITKPIDADYVYQVIWEQTKGKV